MAVLCSLTVGTVLGAIAGYYQGPIDNVIMRVVDIVMCFPLIVLLLSVVAILGPGIYKIMIIIGLSLLPFAWAERTIRSIRRKVPGIPEDGSIPPMTWFMIGLITVGAIVISFLFGAEIGAWISDTWASLWD